MAFNKHRNIFKGISNIIEATSKEEQVHGMFGTELVNIIRKENPEWFDEKMAKTVYDACQKSYAAEEKVINWIYEQGELEFLPKEVTKEFVKDRMNEALDRIGYNKMFEVDEDLVEQTDWMRDELFSTKHVDFFVKRSVNYTKRSRSISGDDLF
jgi:ribonucleoside-diphosphate reductase beta chain